MKESFKTMARLLTHIGDQLISDSTVAIMELVKNAYDAGSESVYITIDQHKRVITIEDQGKGMSREDIKEKYLVIGTTDKLEEKEKMVSENIQENKVPLGEKGLGRFAVMKLGNKLRLITKSKKSELPCELKIDWGLFSYNSKDQLDDIKVELGYLYDIESVYRKLNDAETYTILQITEIKDFYDSKNWNDKKFKEFYHSNFLKFINPFKPNKGFKVILDVITTKENLLRFTPENIDKKLLEQAPYKINGEITDLRVRMDYFIRNEDGEIYSVKDFGFNISEIEKEKLEGEGYVGNIKFECYFFNRNSDRLKEIKGYEKIKDIRDLLDIYSGGIMIFRDGFRVLPYGQNTDDWLEMNSRNQFKGKGVRFNTIQTVGGIFIGALSNYHLKDQTNREGLVNNKAYENLKEMMQSILTTFTSIIESYKVQESDTKKLAADQVISAIQPYEKTLKSIDKNINSIDINTFNLIDRERFINIKNDINQARDLLTSVQASVRLLDQKIDQVEKQQNMILDLAGIGMTAETIAHEMRSYIQTNLDYISLLRDKYPQESDIFSNLFYSTKSLDSIVSRLDLQSVTRKRIKSKVNIYKLVYELCESKKIAWKLNTKDEKNEENLIEINLDWKCKYNIKANPGMIVQIFDNLLNNSYYWLMKYKSDFKDFKPKIEIMFREEGQIEFYDNGFGIPKYDAKQIMEPFFTRRKEGRGLGLYIIQQLISFHEGEIYLSNETNYHGNCYKFIIDFSKCVI